MKPAFCGWGFAGRIAMLLPSRVAGRTLDLRGPDLARRPEVARRWFSCKLTWQVVQPLFTNDSAVVPRKTIMDILDR